MKGCLSPSRAVRHHRVMTPPPNPRPGDAIIDHYLPDATEAEREQARRELKGFAAAIFGVAERFVREGRSFVPIPDSREFESQGRIQPTPPNSP